MACDSWRVVFFVKYIHISDGRSFIVTDTRHAVLRFQIIMCADLLGQWNVEY